MRDIAHKWDGVCDECGQNDLTRQPPLVQTKSLISRPGDRDEQEADRAVAQISGGERAALSANGTAIQRQVLDEAQETSAPVAETAPPAEATELETAPVAEPTVTAETPAGETTSAGLIVEDDASPGPGQMSKTAFLDELRTSACAAADAELAAVGRSTEGCPYVERAISYYRTKDTAHIERAMRKYAPEAAGVTSARDYIPPVTERIRQGVTRWAQTGDMSDVPEELLSQAMGGGVLGSIAGALSSVVSGIGSLFFKAREGGANEANPHAIQAQLGSGSPLEGGVRTRMESAFGFDFSRVRVHTDGQAAHLSSNLNARAFTVGRDVAFGTGEYQPGTMVGDALLAHELAHVVQQGGGATTEGPQQKGNGASTGLEEDADRSAVGAVVSMWGGAKSGLAKVAQSAMPQLKSGLRLSRCKSDSTPTPTRAACANPVKNIVVDLVKLRGSSRTPADDLAFANTVFSPCCVQFTQGANETATRALSDTWLGGDTELRRDSACGAVHAEETALYNGAATEYSLTGRFRAFYVESVNPGTRAYSKPPYCATGAEASQLGMLVITNGGARRTLAHELGHILLNSGDHTGIDDTSDTSNIMVPTNSSTGENIDASQSRIIYSNA